MRLVPHLGNCVKLTLRKIRRVLASIDYTLEHKGRVYATQIDSLDELLLWIRDELMENMIDSIREYPCGDGQLDFFRRVTLQAVDDLQHLITESFEHGLHMMEQSAAEACDALGRVGALHPSDLVEAVDVLLCDVVAREPGEVEPVAHLVLHVTPLRLTTSVPQAACVVGGLHRRDLTERAVVDPLDRLLLRELIAVAETRDHDRALLLRLVTSLPDPA